MQHVGVDHVSLIEIQSEAGEVLQAQVAIVVDLRVLEPRRQICFPAGISYSQSELGHYVHRPRGFTLVAEAPLVDVARTDAGSTLEERLVQDLPVMANTVFTMIRYTTGVQSGGQ